MQLHLSTFVLKRRKESSSTSQILLAQLAKKSHLELHNVERHFAMRSLPRTSSSELVNSNKSRLNTSASQEQMRHSSKSGSRMNQHSSLKFSDSSLTRFDLSRFQKNDSHTIPNEQETSSISFHLVGEKSQLLQIVPTMT